MREYDPVVLSKIGKFCYVCVASRKDGLMSWATKARGLCIVSLDELVNGCGKGEATE